MGCASARSTSFQAVWSKGSTTEAVAHAVTEPMASAEVREVRASFEVRQQSGACQVRVAIAYSDDGKTWDAATEFGPAGTTTEGWTYGTSFVDVTTGHGTRKAWCRFVVTAINSTGTKPAAANVRVRLEFQAV